MPVLKAIDSIETSTGLEWRSVLHMVGFILIPPLVTFGATNTPYETSFRPPPSNAFYDSMLIGISMGIALSQYVISKHYQKVMKTGNAFEIFKIWFSLSNGILYCVGQAWGAGIIWCIWGCTVFATRYFSFGRLHWKPHKPDAPYLWFFSILTFVIAILFIWKPVAESWSGPPEKFVRWYPFNIDKIVHYDMESGFLLHPIVVITERKKQLHTNRSTCI
jgi:hypothetical protein